ncbi:hypothetical protein FM125_06415 [Micrococcus lylae]|uniref:Uncharacterized protein n=1 Tax=Micrococcus lylae TaxID=1273 RepID=A0A1R4J496_9MICC|nr:hypothetical protein [Micrococcus lylae]SJN26858.1 hypothetical protein FM125_06415 [Micrococcus lylae]
MPDLAGVPAELAPPLATLAGLVLIWKVVAEGVKAWRDARQIGRPATPYEALAARVVALEKADAEKSDRIDGLEDKVGALKASVRRLAGVLIREVAHVLAWIDRGAKPPRPDQEIKVIRELIADLTDPDHPHPDKES